jgi:cyclophilin family peptidyl-prolyl cis-trans isomerase
MRRGFRKRAGNGTPASMGRTNLAALAFALAATALGAQDNKPEPVTPAAVIAASVPGEWSAIDPADLLVMDLAPSAKGAPRRVIVQLIPPPFSQGWVGNVRTLAKAHWWDGTSVYRVVDNWVTQWGDGEDDPKKAKPLPPGIVKVPEADYTAPLPCKVYLYQKKVIKEQCDPAVTPIEGIDPYVTKGQTGYAAGWPVAFALQGDGNRIWPVHCYGTVGVARDLSPDTGTGAELYAVIGQAPRQLDRNSAVVGRVIEGMENLSALPRGKGPRGVYDNPALRVPIVSVRLASELPPAEQPHFEYLAGDSQSFADYEHVKANRNDAFYKVPAGGIDVCNLQVPIRRVGAK